MEDLGEELIQAAQEGRLPKVRTILSEAAESPDIAQEMLMSLELVSEYFNDESRGLDHL